MAEPLDSNGAEFGGTGSDGSGSAYEGPASARPATGAVSGGQFLAPREVMIVLPGLLLAILLAMLDNLIVSTALPRIVGDLGGVAHLSWVVTAYILASTITTPFYGKLGDIVAPRERGRYMSYMMVVMMLATIGGPLLGGFITTAFSWRWIFYINLPVGGAALVYLIATLHVPAKKVEHKVDYLGGTLLGVAVTALILLATWGGTQYAWGSVQIVGLALITVAAGVAFGVTETRAAEPMLPLHVFKNRNFSLTMVLTFLTGLAMFGAMTFLPLFQQTVQGESPTVSGLMLTPMMLGVTVTSIVAGQVTTRTGRYKVFPVLGGGIMAVAMYLLTGLGIGTSRLTSALFYVVLGLGMGFLMQMVSLIAQNSVEQKDMGVASSARMFFQQIGGSLGVAAFGAIFARQLTTSLSAATGPGVHISASGGQLDPARVNSLPAVIRHDVFFAIAHAVEHVFVWAVPSAVLIFALAWFIKEVPLRGRAPAALAPSQQPELVS